MHTAVLLLPQAACHVSRFLVDDMLLSVLMLFKRLHITFIVSQPHRKRQWCIWLRRPLRIPNNYFGAKLRVEDSPRKLRYVRTATMPRYNISNRAEIRETSSREQSSSSIVMKHSSHQVCDENSTAVPAGTTTGIPIPHSEVSTRLSGRKEERVSSLILSLACFLFLLA